MLAPRARSSIEPDATMPGSVTSCSTIGIRSVSPRCRRPGMNTTSYISKIYGMLIRHEPRHKLVEHLWLIETEYMGLFGNRQLTEATVNRLLSLRDEVERQR